MSNYRDDTHELITASDSVWGGVRSICEEILYASDSTHGTLRLLTEDTVQVSEALDLRLRLLTDESVQVSTPDLSVQHAQQRVSDSLRVRDAVPALLSVRHEETLQVQDSLLAGSSEAGVNTAQVSDSFILSRRAFTLVVETIHVGDGLRAAQTEWVEETITVTDDWRGWLRTRALVEEQVYGSDDTGVTGGQREDSVETVRVIDAVFTVLHAQQMVEDEVFADDTEVLRPAGQAWVSAVDAWAMSRYAPYNFDSLTVIDGVPYATGEGGVYCLKGEGETITCTLTYGIMDVGGSPLTLPAYCYVGYELEGALTMSVRQTQTGRLQQWTYPLQSLASDELRNGRFVFGKGLRGRYFGFELVAEGEKLLLDNMYLVLANKTRRI